MLNSMEEYQSECIETVLRKINEGAMRLSVTMTTGSRSIATIIYLVKRLEQRDNKKILILSSLKILADQARKMLEPEECTLVDVQTVREFFGSDEEYKYIVLLDVSVADRKQLYSKIAAMKCITISFGHVGHNDVAVFDCDDKSAQSMQMNCYAYHPMVCVSVTREVLDIKDAKYAGELEYQYAIKANIETYNLFVQLNIQTLQERELIEKQNRRLRAYVLAFQELKDQKERKEQKEKDELLAEIERLRSLLQEDEKNKEIEELKTKQLDYEKKLKEKDEVISAQDQLIDYMQTILSKLGIDKETVQESFDQIQALREKLEDDLNNNDEGIREIALKKLQDEVAEKVKELLQLPLSQDEISYYEEYLVAELTKEVWERLDEKSRTFLITAKVNYDFMLRLENREKLDYSGVCLLVTKALEVETAKRFFVYYKEYLDKRFSSVSQWPHSMRKKDRNVVTDSALDDYEFTLGSVVSVMGYGRDCDSQGNVIGYSVKHDRTKNLFCDYAREMIFKYSDKLKVSTELEKDIRFIEKVRIDYRNPAAHRNSLSITSAKECMEYVIDVHHMLRDMLQEMKI